MSEGSGLRVQGSGVGSQGTAALARPASGTQYPAPTLGLPGSAVPLPRIDSPHLAQARRDDGRGKQPPLLAASKLEKSYRKGKLVVPVLKGVDILLHCGQFVSIVGQSGCGKSTLLHLLGTLDAPDSGQIHFEGNRIDDLAPRGRDVLRNRYFGMIFQFYHLLPELSTLENVLAPVMIRYGVLNYWRHKRQHTARAKELLELVGLSHRLTHKPRELSGGEMQRAAIARALIAEPKLLLADEPTGNLDQKTGGEILTLLKRLNRDAGLTILMVTHDQAIARQADRTIRLVEGKVAT
jgi:lipoprotein-releasing system ATP-binding protein